MESIIDFSKLTLEAITVTLKNKYIYIKYNGQSLLIKTPIMISPFGIININNNYYLDLSLQNDNTNVDIFYQWIRNFESRLQILVQSEDPELKAEDFVSCIKNNCDCNGNLRTKIDYQKQSLLFDISYNNQIDKSLVDKLKKSSLYCLLKCQPIWRLNNKWGYSWKVLKIFVKNIHPLNDYAFVDEPSPKKKSGLEDEQQDQELIDSIDIHLEDFKPISNTLSDYKGPDVQQVVKKQLQKMKKKKSFKI